MHIVKVDILYSASFTGKLLKQSIACKRMMISGFFRYCSEKYEKTLTSHNDLVNITEAYVALGGGGLALFGSASFYTWPTSVEEIDKKFQDQTLVDKTRFLDDSGYR